MIGTLVLFANGMVVSFSDAGAQLPEYGGRARDVLHKALQAAAPQTRFYVGDWRNGRTETNKEALTALAEQLQEPGAKV